MKKVEKAVYRAFFAIFEAAKVEKVKQSVAKVVNVTIVTGFSTWGAS